jgi:uncharacterized protein YodC (DUF2158 family)
MAEWKSGDQVQLNSGGPIMTVEFVNQNKVHCTWFVGDKKSDGDFYSDTLKAYRRESHGDHDDG